MTMWIRRKPKTRAICERLFPKSVTNLTTRETESSEWKAIKFGFGIQSIFIHYAADKL